MNAMVLAAALAVGVSTGWKSLGEGRFEYIIQIEPQALEAMKSGQPIISDLPPALRGVRSYRITVGTGPVEREGALPPAEAPAASPPASPPKPLVPDSKSRPIPAEQSASFLQTTGAESSHPQASQPVENEPQKPWVPLMLAMAALLGSLSGNVYLSWITWETRARYRRLLRQSSDDSSMPDCFRLPDGDDPLQDSEL